MESIKKMNLSAIEDRLSLSEMQEIQAGVNCSNGRATAILGGVFTVIGCAVPVAGWILLPSALGLCAQAYICAQQG